MDDIKKLKETINHLRVLFVDDEEQIRKMTGMFFEKFFKDVIICIDGQDGLDTFKKDNNFDIVIADIQMPKMDGITMVKKIKEIKPNIFTIFITASRGEKDCDDSLYDLYITKPISYENMKLIMQKAGEIK